MKEIIEKIIKESINAPSGSNSQPWEFICSENIIRVKYLPHKDHEILNFNNRGTLIACGALIENIVIVARHYGFDTKILINENFDDNIIANLILEQNTNKKNDELYYFIKERSTNRNKFYSEKLKDEDKKYILEESSDYKNMKIYLIEDDNQKEAAKFLANDTYLNFSNNKLRNLIFKEILFDDKLAKEGHEGLYVKTMGFKPPQIFLLKIMKNNNVFNIFRKLNFINKIYQETIKLYSSCGMMIAFSVINEDREFINLGKLIENIWLRLTKLNLSCHLITGVFFFWQKVNFSNNVQEIFNQKEINLINDSYKKLSEIFDSEKNHILTAVMRVGKAKPPLAYSYKKPPNIKWSNK